MSEQTSRPSIVSEKHLEFLDHLREAGITNMYGAGSYLRKAFEIGETDSHTILSYWMQTFAERHPRKETSK